MGKEGFAQKNEGYAQEKGLLEREGICLVKEHSHKNFSGFGWNLSLFRTGGWMQVPSISANPFQPTPDWDEHPYSSWPF